MGEKMGTKNEDILELPLKRKKVGISQPQHRAYGPSASLPAETTTDTGR